MKADLIREKFLKFFERKGHKIVHSDSLLPKDDPTVLFTGAGMNQFKEYFLGIKKDLKRAASSQKCFRTGDIDNVGRTPSHHTFFEMLGNFSFGDYFKKEAIEWAWEFMTQEMGIPEEKLWVSVYKDDDEAYRLWSEAIKVPKKKIIKLGDKENFWPSEAKAKGPNGPCGPCSEIFFDQTAKVGCGRPDCSPVCGCGRFVEAWNLVFTQFNRKEGGALEPLPMKNIDTGMGLERIAAVIQGVHSNFQTDLFAPIVKAVEEQAPAKRQDRQYVHIIADHVRAAAFLIADGVLPSNEGKGYVERMVIRRAARCGRKLGIKGPFLYKLVPSVAGVMKNPYPELGDRRENIAQVLLAEEERFGRTIEEGMQILEDLMSRSASKEIDGEAVFKLYDTYGFPVDLTEEIAREKGFKIDKEGFQEAMQAQKDASRKSSVISGDIFATTVEQKIKQLAGETQFLGYDTVLCKARVTAILRDEKLVKEAKEQDKAWVILDKTVFYGESGGQAGDAGKITRPAAKGADEALACRDMGPGQAILDVVDTKIFDKAIVHICAVRKGPMKTGDEVIVEIDVARRLDIAKSHTATHLLHAALRRVLGEHVHQSGSLVAAGRLRFDFTHFKALTNEQIDRVEELVNADIRRNDKVSVRQMALEKAKAEGATALFGEKYQEKVRVVSIGDYSKELCGGTHLEETGQIGMFKIIGEGSISAGTRRIEAVTGKSAADLAGRQAGILKELSRMLNVPEGEVVEKIQAMQDEVKKLQASLERSRRKTANQQADELILNCKQINGVKVIASEIKDADIDVLRAMSDYIKGKASPVAVLLAACVNGNVSLILAFSQDVVKRGANAGELIKDISSAVGGSGGGRPDMAQAGGKSAEKLQEAFKRFEELLRAITV